MIKKYLAHDEKVSLILADVTNFIDSVKKIQKLNNYVGPILEEFYIACGLMAFSDMKEESDEIVVELDSNGKAGLLYSVVRLSNNNSIIKGFIENKALDKDYDRTELIGEKGNLIITKKNKYTKLGYRGITPLISNNVLENFKKYFEDSTQKKSFLDVEISDKKSYGYLITFMPDCSDECIMNIEKNINSISFKELVNNYSSFDDIAKKIVSDDNIEIVEENLDIIYRCDCNKEKFLNMFYTLKKEVLEKLIENDDIINVSCDYCDKTYDFSKEELQEIINNL